MSMSESDVMMAMRPMGEASVATPTHADTFVKLCLLWIALNSSKRIPPACKGVLNEKNLEHLKDRESLAKFLSSTNASKFNKNKPFGFEQHDNDDDDEDDEDSFHSLARDPHSRYKLKYTSRTLSVIGVLGGIVLILLVIALSTCVRTRRNIMSQDMEFGPETLSRHMIFSHVRHLRSGREGRESQNLRNDRPPSYDDVVKDRAENQLESGAPEICSGEILDQYEAEPPSYIEAIHSLPEGEVEGVISEASDNHVVTIEVDSVSSSSSESSLQEQARQQTV